MIVDPRGRTFRNRWRRRLVSVPAVFALFAVSTSLLPLLVLIGTLVDLARGDRRLNLARLFVFLPVYCAAEVVGLTVLALSWLRDRGSPERFARVTYRVQGAWTQFLLGAISRIFSLRFTVRDADRFRPGPTIVLVTHASIVDTLLPTALLSVPLGMRLRFVLKEELLVIPCLDVAGHRVPNCFVSRSGQNTAEEVARVRALASDLGADDALLLYPEGTRFTPKKLTRALEKLERTAPERRARLSAARTVLPIQPGGVLGVFEAAPEADLVIVSHVGLHGTAELSDIAKNGLAGRVVTVFVDRYPRAELPRDGAALLAWLDERWLEIDQRLVDSTP
jgi:1-acyl-sn-glycerol-3-phosphate acyltransferase